MKSVEKQITVNVPLSTAYNQWTQFESFPQFMEGIESVQQMDDKSLHWVAEIGGKRVEWNAEITQQEPDRVIAWRSTSGAENAGTVRFRAEGTDKCVITLRIEYEPEGLTEELGSFFGAVDARVEGDLRRFKEFIESRGTETGAWRGEIQGRRVARSGHSETTGVSSRIENR